MLYLLRPFLVFLRFPAFLLRACRLQGKGASLGQGNASKDTFKLERERENERAKDRQTEIMEKAWGKREEELGERERERERLWTRHGPRERKNVGERQRKERGTSGSSLAKEGAIATNQRSWTDRPMEHVGFSLVRIKSLYSVEPNKTELTPIICILSSLSSSS